MLEEPPTNLKIDIRSFNVSILSSILNHQKVGKDNALQYRVKGCHETATGSLKFDMVYNRGSKQDASTAALVCSLASLCATGSIDRKYDIQMAHKGHHEAATGSLKFDMVQAEIERRKQIGCLCSGPGVFLDKLIKSVPCENRVYPLFTFELLSDTVKTTLKINCFYKM